jgi:hypothetical protein
MPYGAKLYDQSKELSITLGFLCYRQGAKSLGFTFPILALVLESSSALIFSTPAAVGHFRGREPLYGNAGCE